METRATRRRGLQQVDEEKMTSSLGDNTKIKDNFNDRMASNRSDIDSKRKMNPSKSNNSASANKSNFDETIVPFIRPPIRELKKNTAEDKTTSGLDHNTKIKDSFSDHVASNWSDSESKWKMEAPKTSNFVSPHKGNRQDGPNYVHRDREIINEDNEDEEYDEKVDEEENSEEEMTHSSNIHKPSSKVPYSDYIQEEGDQSNLRSRKGEKSELVHKPHLRKANEKVPPQEHELYSDDEEDPPEPQSVKGNLWILIFTVFALVLALGSLGIWILVLKKPPIHQAEEKLQILTTFQDGSRKLQMLFSGQSTDLWQRSLRILELQLRNGDQNQQPAIILLTAAQDAEQMLHCVGNQLAKIYASSFNSSYTVLSGLKMTSEDSEEVKMDIDRRLSAGFQANNKAAVLHRLELLPPGSLIILYKYCDHENAAFKNIALVLTVLLKDKTLQPDIELKELEETVYEFLKETFINHVKSTVSHNEMDGDKLGGLWSRISHVVLPVLPGKTNVKECGESNAGP
ncbi:uncharacterized protein ACMZJ9_011460 isoform 2-T2 [Mantella aurantiaca]